MTIGRQVNFHMHPDDLAEFEQALRERGGVCFIEGRLPTPEVRTTSTFTATNAKTWRRFYLAREAALGEIVTEEVPKQGYWLVDWEKSPVVEFDGCYFDGKLIRRGRLYYWPRFLPSYDDDACWEMKPQDFVSWADGILRWIRRHYRMGPLEGFYVGPHAWEWFNQKPGRVLDVGGRSSPVSPLSMGG